MYIDIPKIMMSYSNLLEDEPLRRASVRTLQGDLEKATIVIISANFLPFKKDIPYHVLLINTRSKSPEEISRRKLDLVNRVGFENHFVFLNLEEMKELFFFYSRYTSFPVYCSDLHLG